MGTSNTIHFFNEAIHYSLRGKKRRINWLIKSIKLEKRIPGFISYIFCDDAYLLQLNKKYLKHDFYTDIITFGSSKGEEEVAGDVFISIERVRENAKNYRVRIDDEIDRLLIHGILHLAGYKDKKKMEKELMTQLEDKYLSIR